MRHHTLAAVAIAALAAAAALPAAGQTSGEAPAKVTCKDGRVVAIKVLLPEAGWFTLHLPPDVCAKASRKPRESPQAPARRPAAST